MKRVTTLMAPKDLGASGTEIVAINVQDQISRIVVLFSFA